MEDPVVCSCILNIIVTHISHHEAQFTRAGEAEDVVRPAHGAAPRALAHYPLPTLDTSPQTVAVTRAAAQRLEMLLLAAPAPRAGVEHPGLGRDHRLVVALRVVVEAGDLAGQDVGVVRLSQLTVRAADRTVGSWKISVK